MKIYCVIKDCENFIESEQATENTQYLCRKHAPMAPDVVRFQEDQFDKGLTRGEGYIGDPFREGGIRIDSRAPNIDFDDSSEEGGF